MKYSEIADWDRLRRRYLSFWDGKVEDGSVIAHIQNPNPSFSTKPPEAWMLEASESKYLDPEKLYRLKKWRRGAWNWHADLFKYEIPTYGPNVFAGFCGARVEFGENTVWHEPAISSTDEFDKIHFDTGNRYWKALLESIDYLVANYSGKIHIGLPDFGGPGDWISSIMGSENFLIACAEEPDRMRDFALRLVEECNSAFEIAYRRIGPANDGSVNWMPAWSAQRMATVQDDFSMNFSPQMYSEIFLPSIRKMASAGEKTVLHWHDACSQHIGWVAAEESIDLIQFGHDPNTGSFRDHLPHMRKIQSTGKRLFISCVRAEDAQFFIENLDPRGLMMIIDTDSDDASMKMEEDVRLWTKDRLARMGL